MSRKNLGYFGILFLFISVYLLYSSIQGGKNEINKASMKVLIYRNGEKLVLETDSLVPNDWLIESGIELADNEEILISGVSLNPTELILFDSIVQVQINPRNKIKIENEGNVQQVDGYSSNPLALLWKADIQLKASDSYSEIFETRNFALADSLLPFTIIEYGKEFYGHSNAETVGEALAENSLALQGADYSVPSATSKFETNQAIEIVRVREEIILETETTPFWLEYQPVADLEIDLRSVVQFGEYGIEAKKIRVIYENGIEVNRFVEETWVAKEVVPQIEGYGTKIIVRTIDTADGVIEYWRSLSMWATSYSPCRSDGAEGACYYGTSLGIPVEKGVVAFLRSWYLNMKWQTVYVPGYGPGTVADVGAGIAGKDWIDLGYTDDDYQSWAKWVTVYFITPVPPANEIMYILP
jgi:resuscitation-promoting factor RpfB